MNVWQGNFYPGEERKWISPLFARTFKNILTSIGPQSYKRAKSIIVDLPLSLEEIWTSEVPIAALTRPSFPLKGL
jgi:hypothetical protein